MADFWDVCLFCVVATFQVCTSESILTGLGGFFATNHRKAALTLINELDSSCFNSIAGLATLLNMVPTYSGHDATTSR